LGLEEKPKCPICSKPVEFNRKREYWLFKTNGERDAAICWDCAGTYYPNEEAAVRALEEKLFPELRQYDDDDIPF